MPCAGLKAAPKQKEWFCQLCKQNVHITKKQNIDTKCIGSAVNRLRLKREKRKVTLSGPALSKQTIIVSSGEDEIDEQDNYEISPGTKLLQSDFDLLKNPNGWLSRRLINAGQMLLKKKFPKVGGLHDVGKMQTGTFEQEHSEFVQVLHCYESHWVLATNKNCKEKQIIIYDSNRSGDVSLDTKEAIASMIKISHPYFYLTFPDVQQQTGDSDYGLYTLAFAYSLCNGKDPAKISYKQAEFRTHLLQCIEKKAIKDFPQERVMKVPGKAMLCKVKVYCVCRLPDAGDGMIKCSKCSASFHCTCVDVVCDDMPQSWCCTSCS